LFLNASVEIDENLLSPFHEMYLYGKKHDIHFMTLDVVEKFEDMDGFLFLDFPNLKNSYVKQALKLDLPKYLVIFESEAIKPDNWNSDNHKIFDKIFTWSDELIDNNKYFKLNFPHSLPKTINNYSLSKAQFKEWLKLDSRIKISNIRIDLIYGANDNQNTFLSKLINSMKSNSKQKIKLTSGLQKRDFIYVTDVVDAIKIIVKKEHLLDHYSEIDITTGRFVMVKDFIEKIISKLESKSQILIKKRLGFGEISYRNDEIMEPSLSGSFIKAFGWTPKVTHEEGILKILEQYK